ncbi:MAG: hypothetical protein ACKOHG_06420, partial [Planctomycetia bacterium]
MRCFLPEPALPKLRIVACAAMVCAVSAAAEARQPPQRPAAQPAAPQRVAAVPGQPMPQPAAPQQPAPLSPEQQAALDRLLAAWEARNAAVTTWSCTFHKWEYNAWSPADASGERLAFAESTGELKYASPDKGLFRIKETK